MRGEGLLWIWGLVWSVVLLGCESPDGGDSGIPDADPEDEIHDATEHGIEADIAEFLSDDPEPIGEMVEPAAPEATLTAATWNLQQFTSAKAARAVAPPVLGAATVKALVFAVLEAGGVDLPRFRRCSTRVAIRWPPSPPAGRSSLGREHSRPPNHVVRSCTSPKTSPAPV